MTADTIGHYDEKMASWVIKETDDWVVSVTPMIFNDRLLFTTRADYPMSWTAGWCYDKGGAAHLAALAWDPDTQRDPVGFKKVAGDAR
jgi:hypothetical protein